MDMAAAVGGTIINGDCVQLYGDLPILSAMPSPHDMARIPHDLYGVLPAHHQTTVATWIQDALKAIQGCRQGGRVPIVVGGTGFYLKTLQDGLAPIPDVTDSVKDAVVGLCREKGNLHLYDRLAAVDPLFAARIHPHDTQRLCRAYGVFLSSGRPLSHWIAQPHDAPLKGCTVLDYRLLPSRDQLYRQAALRLNTMMTQDVEGEVRTLMAKDPIAPTLEKALGFREMAAYIGGHGTKEEAITQTLQATCHYIKRQRTWFQSQRSNTSILLTGMG